MPIIMPKDINPGPVFNVGDKVMIRPSQQLYWKVYFGHNVFNDKFKRIEDNVTKVDNHLLILSNQGHINKSWVDWTLEGNLEHDYAATNLKTIGHSAYKEYLINNPLCMWCHEPIKRRLNGEFKGHWEHKEKQSNNTFSPINNLWNCDSYKTVDNEWHVAEHPMDGIGKYKSNYIFPIPDYVYKHFSKPIDVDTTVISMSHASASQYNVPEVITITRGRKFKTIE